MSCSPFENSFNFFLLQVLNHYVRIRKCSLFLFNENFHLKASIYPRHSPFNLTHKRVLGVFSVARVKVTEQAVQIGK